jgi:hypothetical protein
MLVLNHPRAIDLSQAECRSHQVLKRSPVRQHATAAYEAMGESDVATGSDGQILKIEHSFSLRVWLPLAPAAPV